jgi:tRNA(Arg) A34 adenosine deaminase TadA
VHAEIDAIKQYISTCRKPTKKRIKAHMVVLRKNVNNEYVTSKPCKHCLDILKSSDIEQFINIKNITHHDGSAFITETLNVIKNNHVSSGWRHYY